jgi:serine/threonine protein kinase
MAFKPKVFGKYVLLKRIAIGGMAEVFRAKAFGAEGFEKFAAVKRMLPHLSSDSLFVDMFINEAKLAAKLNHANIAQIYDFGCIDKQYFISMEYVRGKDIADIIRRLRENNLFAPIELACHLFIQVLNGLDYAHRQKDSLGNPLNLIHRDVSPHNILVSYEGEVKIVDFGIAKATSSTVHTTGGVLKGKYSYMSPEQARGSPLDHRTDIFSLGICLYELLTLTKMFHGESDLSILEKVRETEFIRPSNLNSDISSELEDIIMKALAKDPNDRWESASQWRDALEQYLFANNLHYTTSWLAGFMRQVFLKDLEKAEKTIAAEALDLQNFKTRALTAARKEIMRMKSKGVSVGDKDLRSLIKELADGESGEEYDDDSDTYTQETVGFALPQQDDDEDELDGADEVDDEDIVDQKLNDVSFTKEELELDEKLDGISFDEEELVLDRPAEALANAGPRKKKTSSVRRRSDSQVSSRKSKEELNFDDDELEEISFSKEVPAARSKSGRFKHVPKTDPKRIVASTVEVGQVFDDELEEIETASEAEIPQLPQELASQPLVAEDFQASLGLNMGRDLKKPAAHTAPQEYSEPRDSKSFPFGVVFIVLLLGVVGTLAFVFGKDIFNGGDEDKAANIEGLDLSKPTKVVDKKPRNVESDKTDRKRRANASKQSSRSSDRKEKAKARSKKSDEMIVAAVHQEQASKSNGSGEREKSEASVSKETKKPSSKTKRPEKKKSRRRKTVAKAEKGFGSVSVGMLGGWAFVYIDGVKIRETPLFKHKLKVGKYKIQLKDPDGKIIKTFNSVVIEKDENKNLVHK